LGPREDGDGDRLYIGEGDPIGPRLAAHHSSPLQKDFWTRASMGQGLNKAHVQFLESNLIRLAKQAKRVPLDVENKKNETEPTLSEADRADMQVFLAHMLGMLPVLGVHAFEQPPAAHAASAPELTCRGKGLEAWGYESTQGFVVQAKSKAAVDVVPSIPPSTLAMRQQLLDLGVLAQQGSALAFSQDYTFSSPSTAASVVLGRSANGRMEWKDGQGRSLKVLQELSQASVSPAP
jgi:hypothetical protein